MIKPRNPHEPPLRAALRRAHELRKKRRPAEVLRALGPVEGEGRSVGEYTWLRAEAHDQIGEREAAYEWASHGHANTPGTPALRRLLLRLLIDRGDLGAVSELLPRVVRDTPTRPDFIAKIARLLRRQRRPGLCRDAVTLGLERFPADRNLTLERAQLLIGSGKLDAARRMLADLVVSDPHDPRPLRHLLGGEEPPLQREVAAARVDSLVERLRGEGAPPETLTAVRAAADALRGERPTEPEEGSP